MAEFNEDIACKPCDPLAAKNDNDSDEETELPPAHRLVIPSDAAAFSEDDDIIYIVGTRGCKVTKIAGLENMKNLQELVLRCCLIRFMDGINHLITLQKLELYDNQIQKIESIDSLKNLKILDLSFNCIRDMSPVKVCNGLQELYIAQNKLRSIQGLEDMPNLKILDLGANRIRSMEGLQYVTSLKSLWLGKNKIESITNITQMTNLKQLDIQSNRLQSIENIATLLNLEELYLAHNNINNLVGLASLGRHEKLNHESDIITSSCKLTTLDVSSNPMLCSFHGIEHLISLTELWMSATNITSFDQIQVISTTLTKLECIYLEFSPLSKDFEYRKKLTEMIPSLAQIDAVAVRR
mmetsp:Transcript_9816/g.9914  ORF Transcript_9816/g.9914 Transcript_9816/m.9914 type:complete len:353 (+) Transcript_9816:112-1170(+)